MLPIFSALLSYLASLVFPDTSLHLKLLALEHQLAVYKRSVRRPRLHPSDRLFWAWISRHWSGWQEALVFVSQLRSSPGKGNDSGTTGAD